MQWSIIRAEIYLELGAYWAATHQHDFRYGNNTPHSFRSVEQSAFLVVHQNT